jgi:hypothetical protein
MGREWHGREWNCSSTSGGTGGTRSCRSANSRTSIGCIGIGTNLPFSEWGSMFPDPRLVAATSTVSPSTPTSRDWHRVLPTPHQQHQLPEPRPQISVSAGQSRDNDAVTDPTWQQSMTILRDLSNSPAALGNATTLALARSRWEHTLVARTSMHDLLFTRPGDDHPFTTQVRVQWRDGISTILRWQDEVLAEETNADAMTVDATLDAVLEHLTAPALICRRCRRPVVISADQFEVFERMHYSCFH